jgi:hypothetical protein
MVVLCAVGIANSGTIAPLPLNFHTISWLMALFFPVSAILYVIARICFRRDEILTYFRRGNLWIIYHPDSSDPESEFIDFLSQRLKQYYNLVEFAGYAFLTGAITLTVSYLLSAQFKVPTIERFVGVMAMNADLKIPELSGPVWATLSASGYLGAYSGAVIYLLQRYRTFDLYPSSFLQISVILIAGTFSSTFFTLIYPTPSLGAFAFVMGFVSAINVNFLARLMRAQCAKFTGTPLPEDIPSDLPDIVRNSEAIESLNSISIYSIRELAHSEPVRLYLNMPEQIGTVNLMIDQALLHFYFSSITDQLKAKHIHKFSQLIMRLGIKFVGKGMTTWPDIKEVNILDNGGPSDLQLLQTTRAVVEGYSHHSVLGMLLCDYKDSFFAPATTIKSTIIKSVPA